MATDSEGLGSPLTMDHIEPEGDLSFPVAPGKPFATLKSDNPPPDLASSGAVLAAANLDCDIAGGTLSSTILGMVADTGDGLYVKPLWSVSEDRMALTLDVYPKDCFGEALSDEALRKSIPESCQRMDNDALDAAVAQAEKKNGVVKDVSIGLGNEPENGRDGALKLKFQESSSVGAIQENGSLDYRERGGTICVVEGDEIALAMPASKGRPGADVLGEVIPAEDGAPVTVKTGKGVVSEEDAGGIITFKADSPGMVVYSDGTLSISDVVEINSDVDLSSGNIHVEKGSVLIKGTVTTGATVTAEEHVVVEDVVENATIKAGGNVTVAGGILMEEGGLIDAGGNVEAKFMRNATIRAGGDVIVDVDYVNCDIVTKGRIIAESDKGAANGGEYTCAGMDVAEVGSDVGAPTAVTLALPMAAECTLDDQICAFKDKIAELEKYIGSGDIKETLLLAPKEDRSILLELFKIKAGILKRIKTLEEAKDAALEEQSEELSKIKLRARRTAHAGVTINVGGRSITLNKAEQASKFHWDAEQCGIAIMGL